MKRVILILLLFASYLSYGQKQTSIWYFGGRAGIDFTKNPPEALKSAESFYSMEGCASICDEFGTLQFYTNGDSVWNRNHKVMANGYDLGQPSYPLPGSSSQGSIIIPVPDSDSLYYIFVTDNAEHRLANGFRYSIVDMSLNGGLGDVTTRAYQLIDSVCEKLTAIRHSNCKDIWVLAHEYNSDAFHAYLVTSSGLDPIPVISNTGQVQTGLDKKAVNGQINVFPQSIGRGCMQFSPDGKKLMVLTFSDYHKYPIPPEMFNFDATCGKVTYDFTFDDPDSTEYYSATFSSDSRILYLSSGWHGLHVHQFDMSKASSSATFLSSKVPVYEGASISNPPLPGTLSLAPDGKIYIPTNKAWLDVINNPSVLGVGCGYQEKAFPLIHLTWSNHSLPNFIQSYFLDSADYFSCYDSFNIDFSFRDSCMNSSSLFMDLSIMHPEEIRYRKWDFGDPASGPLNISSEVNPVHNYGLEGEYIVTLIVGTDTPNIACKVDSIKRKIRVIECDSVVEGNDTIFKVYIPSAYTPNADELNPVFRVYGDYIQSVDMKIYDRWGERIFNRSGDDVAWNGLYDGERCQEGVYYYKIEVLFKGGYKESYTGIVHLLL